MSKNLRKIRIFSALEVANLCGVVNQTAINWIRNGYMKAFTTPGGQYRIYAEELTRFLESRGMRIPAELEEHFHEDVDWLAVLVVEDDHELNELLKRFLDRRLPGFGVVQARDGFEAGHLVAEKRPGFVLLDVDLPGLDGLAVCHRIKLDPLFGKPFVIAITGLDRPDIRETMLAEGADAFFAKPLDFEELALTILALADRVKVRDAP